MPHGITQCYLPLGRGDIRAHRSWNQYWNHLVGSADVETIFWYFARTFAAVFHLKMLLRLLVCVFVPIINDDRLLAIDLRVILLYGSAKNRATSQQVWVKGVARFYEFF